MGEQDSDEPCDAHKWIVLNVPAQSAHATGYTPPIPAPPSAPPMLPVFPVAAADAAAEPPSSASVGDADTPESAATDASAVSDVEVAEGWADGSKDDPASWVGSAVSALSTAAASDEAAASWRMRM